jgi:hypothetical protein
LSSLVTNVVSCVLRLCSFTVFLNTFHSIHPYFTIFSLLYHELWREAQACAGWPPPPAGYSCARRRTHGSHKEETECQAFSPVVRIGSSHPPQPQVSVASPRPLLVPRGEDTLACWRGGAGGANSDERTDTLVLYVYYNPSTIRSIILPEREVGSSWRRNLYHISVLPTQ